MPERNGEGMNKIETRYLIITLGILLIGAILGVLAIRAIPVRANPISEPIVYLYKQWVLKVEYQTDNGTVIYPALQREPIPKQWQSVQEFEDWYRAQGFTLLFPSDDYLVDCDDYAEQVRLKALKQAYSISDALTWNGRYYNKRVTDAYTSEQPGHVGSLVEIQDTYYYFEPEIDKFNGLVKVIERD